MLGALKHNKFIRGKNSALKTVYIYHPYSEGELIHKYYGMNSTNQIITSTGK